MGDESDRHLDVADGDELEEGPGGGSSSLRGRPWVGIVFECCTVYSRVYRNRPGTAYIGWCPQCGRRIRISIGTDGTNARFFSAS